MSDASLEVSRVCPPDHYLPAHIIVRTRFGLATLAEIPTGVKTYALILLAIRAQQPIVVLESTMGISILRKVFELAKHTDLITLYTQSEQLSSSAYDKKAEVYTIVFNGKRGIYYVR